MAYYCGECAVWQGSSDSNKYGERWCAYSRRYEKSDQNTYGCRGFVYVGRAVITAVCEILEQDAEPFFASFDEVKEKYLIPSDLNQLVAYCGIGPRIAAELHTDSDKVCLAKRLMNKYLKPARVMCADADYSAAVNHYSKMIGFLKERYDIQ